jgi:hypothetical protein
MLRYKITMLVQMQKIGVRVFLIYKIFNLTRIYYVSECL